MGGAAASEDKEAEEEDDGQQEAEAEAKKCKKASKSLHGPGFGGAAAVCLANVLNGPYVTALMNTLTGVFAISLYFMDIISDVQVIQLLYSTKNYLWAVASIAFLVVQFFIVYLRCLPYLKSTFGSGSTIYITFVILGFPGGLLFLDSLMFLEPFGLLAVLPFPPWLRQFLPACKKSGEHNLR